MNLLDILGLFIDFGFAGGGGSGGGGGGGHSHSSSHGGGGSFGEPWDTILALASLGIYVVIIYFAIRKSKKEKKKKELGRASYTDNDRKQLNQANNIFVQYQMDWTKLDCENMKNYMTDEYYQHACLMLEAITSMYRQNLVSDLKVKEVDFENYKNVSPRKNIHFEFAGRDMLYDIEKNEYIVNSYVTNANETWQFVEDENGNLLLDKIIQPTRSSAHTVAALNKFADSNKLFYSQDWGRYAMPNRGMIFNGASFTMADINNHIVGKWGDVLIQLYTFAKIVSNPSKYYLVGQLTVPKKYTGIIVRNKNAKKLKIPKGYDKYELEWEDFNRHFELYATDPDKIASFELLNPKFMANLYDHGIECSLEVIEDKIYIFANIRRCGEKEYGSMLDILTEAHRELKK